MERPAERRPLTNPDRVLYPGQGLTKSALASYYEAVAEWILPHVVARPLTLVRCPQGRHHTCFWQKHATGRMPPGIRTVEIREAGGRGTYLHVEEEQGLLGLVQLGTLEIHTWGSRLDDLERPDRMVFDLDPGQGVAWVAVIEAAVELRERLRRLDLESFVRLTGGKGLHVVVPLARRVPWDRLKAFSRAVATSMVEERPDHYLAKASRSARSGKIFLDWLRNARGATAVASYSTRALPGAPVAAPLRWDELTPAVAPDRYKVDGLRRRLAALASDPWEGFFEVRQGITRAAELRLELTG